MRVFRKLFENFSSEDKEQANIFTLLDQGVNVKGLAHITGGGLLENIPRILPKNCEAKIKLGTWDILPVFNAMQSIGNIEQNEMFRTFNMGIGMIIIVSKNEVAMVEDLIASESLFQKPIKKQEDSPKSSQKIKLLKRSEDIVNINIDEMKIDKKRKYLECDLLSSPSINLEEYMSTKVDIIKTTFDIKRFLSM